MDSAKSTQPDIGTHYPEHVAAVTARYDDALAKAGAGYAVVFSGAPKLRFLDDNYYPFTANPHFVSWLPLTAMPHCYLVYAPGKKPRLIYFQEKDYWHSPPAMPEGYWTAHFDIRIVHTHDEIPKHLPANRDNCILIGEIEEDAQA
ncbi:MAG: hypothetical protein WD672_12680, partial [Woeseia sp.]